MARNYGLNSDRGQAAAAYKQQELEERQRRRSVIERVVSVLFVVFGIMVLMLCILGKNDYDIRTAHILDELSNRQLELEQLNSTKDDSSRVIEVETVASSAKDAGMAVCEAQNDLNKAVKQERESGSEYLTKQHQDALERLRAYIPSDFSNSSSARGTWCEYGVWEFNGVYDYEGDKTTVVFKCYEQSDRDKDRLLAFVTADYSALSGVFSNVNVRLTSWYTTVSDGSGDFVTPDEYGQGNGDGPDDNTGVGPDSGSDSGQGLEQESEQQDLDDVWNVTSDQGRYNNGDD